MIWVDLDSGIISETEIWIKGRSTHELPDWMHAGTLYALAHAGTDNVRGRSTVSYSSAYYAWVAAQSARCGARR